MAIWNKHILFVHDKGQMCNNIIQYSHVYAWAREHNVCTISLRFAYKYQYFRICHTFWHNIVTHTIVKGLARMHILPIELFEIPYIPESELEKKLTSHSIMVVTGWHIRFYDLFAKYRNEIVHLFSFDRPIEQHVARVLSPWRSDPDNVLLGVHIRRGDYDRVLDGRYFYDDETFAYAIRQFRELQPYKHLVVVACGNDEIDKRYFRRSCAAVDFVFPEGNPAEDLCALSHCDYLLGPPSSYSLVASMYRDLPLYYIFSAKAPFTMADFHSFDHHLRHFDEYFMPTTLQ